MKITGTCTDCLISRVRLECTLCNATEAKTAEAVAECTALLEDIRDAPLSHPQIASRIHRKAYEILGTSDPFARLKREGNNQAIEVCKKVQGNLVTFRDYVLAAVIGNTFDYGVKGHVVAEDFSVF
ncbi:MAG: ARMT1-like domain-containing protein, partial [Methanoregula sp.]|nr:ARMT1-like domain-containing protein [Methanoregula sp.]